MAREIFGLCFYARLVLSFINEERSINLVLNPLVYPLFLCPVGLNLFVRVLYIQVKEANHKMLLTQASQHILCFQLRPVGIICLSWSRFFYLIFFLPYLSFYAEFIIIYSIIHFVMRKILFAKLDLYSQRIGKLASRASNRRCLLRWRRKRRIRRIANPKLLPNTAVLRSRQHRWRLIRRRRPRHWTINVAPANNWIRVFLYLQRGQLPNAASSAMRAKSVGFMCFPTIAA